MQEHAREEREKYKEGKSIIEKAKVMKVLPPLPPPPSFKRSSAAHIQSSPTEPKQVSSPTNMGQQTDSGR